MKICHSTWVRYHHFDLARELEIAGCLEHTFTCLPWWKASKESKEQNIPRNKISCNFFYQGLRRVGRKLPGYSREIDSKLSVLETKLFSKWVAKNLPECDSYIGISGSGLHAGRVAQSRGSGYIMDRGSTQIRHANEVLGAEFKKWKLPWIEVSPWLIENEELEAEQANLITVPSHFVKATFVKQGLEPSKIRVVPYGVSLKEFYPTGEPLESEFNLTFVGQFSLRKGALYLLEAFKAFKHPKKKLTIVGHVDPLLADLIGKIGTEHVKFVGTVPRYRVKDYLSKAHALVLPSLEEGLALVQGQALACGCPVISTPNTGSETLFNHEQEGFIVPFGDINALVDAFITVSTEKSQKIMRVAALARAMKLGGWGDYAKSIIAISREAKTLASMNYSS